MLEKSKLPLNANDMSGRFVQTSKDVRTASESPKARYVAQGFKNMEKDLVVHNAATP